MASMLDTYFVSNLCHYMHHCNDHLLPYRFFLILFNISLSKCLTPLLFLRPMALAGSRAVANPRAGSHACGYSQGEGDVLTLGHSAIQRDVEGLVGLCVTLSAREMYLYLVMEDCREKIETSADQSLWKHHSP